MGRWIRCVECNQVAHVTEYDNAPHYQYDKDIEKIIEKPMDDMKCFMAQHRDHEMEELTVVKNSFISEGNYGDPLKVSYFEATNGRGKFVIKGWRENINTSLRYEIIPGYIKTTFHLMAQSNEIRKQMSEEITHPPIEGAKIEQFIQIIEMVVSQFSMRDKIEITAESNTPHISYCRMGTSCIKEILRLSEAIFNAEELRQVEQFIYQNNKYSEPMTLLFKRAFNIKKRVTAPLKSKEEQSLLDEAVTGRSSP